MITKLEGMICYSVSYDIGTCHTLSHANAFQALRFICNHELFNFIFLCFVFLVLIQNLGKS